MYNKHHSDWRDLCAKDARAPPVIPRRDISLPHAVRYYADVRADNTPRRSETTARNYIERNYIERNDHGRRAVLLSNILLTYIVRDYYVYSLEIVRSVCAWVLCTYATTGRAASGG